MPLALERFSSLSWILFKSRCEVRLSEIFVPLTSDWSSVECLAMANHTVGEIFTPQRCAD